FKPTSKGPKVNISNRSKALRRKKLNLWQAFRKQKSNTNLKQKYMSTLRHFQNSIKRDEAGNEKKWLKYKCSDFFKCIRSKLKSNSGLPTIKAGDLILQNDLEKAEALNDFFSS